MSPREKLEAAKEETVLAATAEAVPPSFADRVRTVCTARQVDAALLELLVEMAQKLEQR